MGGGVCVQVTDGVGVLERGLLGGDYRGWGRSVAGRRNWVGVRARCGTEKACGAGTSVGWQRSGDLGTGQGRIRGKSRQKMLVEDEDIGQGRFGFGVCRATLHTVPIWGGWRWGRAEDRDEFRVRAEMLSVLA